MTASAAIVVESQALFGRLRPGDGDLKQLTARALVELHHAIANLDVRSPALSSHAARGTTAVALLATVAGEARRRRRISRDDEARIREGGDEVRRVLSSALSLTRRGDGLQQITTREA